MLAVQVCRCVPFLIKQFELGELTDRHTIRRAVADRFVEHKARTNPDVRFDTPVIAHAHAKAPSFC